MANPLYDALVGKHRENSGIFLSLPSGEEMTFAQFVDLSARIAGVLLSGGVTVGDRVAVQAPKTPETLALYAACLQVGSIFLPLNTAYTAAEVEYFLADSAPALFVRDGRSGAAFEAAARDRGIRTLSIAADGTGSLPEQAAATDPATFVAERGTDDVAAILYTSGTTGRSKGAMLTHRNLLSNTEVLIETWRFTRDDVLLHALPIYHAHGLFVGCNIMLAVGGRLIFQPDFNIAAVLDAIPHATAMMGVPTHYVRMLASPLLDAALTAGVRLFISGSAPLSAETHDAFAQRTGHRILERYGMTEALMITSNPYEGERRAGTVGRPLAGISVRVAGSEGDALAPGDVGMIEISGPNLFKGYWNMPDKTATEHRPDGFFITGDLGRIDADGYVHIVGRGKDLVISGGFNVYPKEVETELDRLPGVLESAVIGVSHPDFGEGVTAVVVPKPGAILSEDEAIDALKTRLAAFKCPKRILFVDELPRNTMGKVQKQVLREKYANLYS